MLKLKCCKLPDYFYFTVLLKLSCRVFTSLESHHQNGCDKIGNIIGLKTLGFQDHSRKLFCVSFMVLEQDPTIRSFMLKWLFILLISLILSTELFADYFKWEILVSENGYGTESHTIPVDSEGKIKSAANLAECRMASFWTRIESELLLEGKTLVCVFEDKRQSVSVVCRDNHLNRKYNRVKELYPVAKDGFRINPELGAGSPYFELRCYF